MLIFVPDFKEIIIAVGMVLHVEDGKVEQDLLPGLDFDDPGALSSVIVVAWPARRVKNPTRGKEIPATCWKNDLNI